MVVASDKVGDNSVAPWVIVHHVLHLVVDAGAQHRSAIDPRNVAVNDVAGVQYRSDAFLGEQIILRVQCVQAAFLAGEVSVCNESESNPVPGVDKTDRQIAESGFAKLNIVFELLNWLTETNLNRFIRPPEGFSDLFYGFSFCAKVGEVL